MNNELTGVNETVRKSKGGWVKYCWSIVNSPLGIVILSAILGSWIAVTLQDRSFRRNELFKAKLDLIMEGRKASVELFQDTDSILRRIRSTQSRVEQEMAKVKGDTELEKTAKEQYCNEGMFSTETESLKKIQLRVKSVKDYSTNSNDEINKLVDSIITKLDDYIACAKYTECKSCQKEHEAVTEDLRSLVSLQTKLASKLVSEQ